MRSQEVLLEIRDYLKGIDHKLSHIIEQNREERIMFMRDYSKQVDNDD